VCSSICARREGVDTLTPEWAKDQDGGEISKRLAGRGKAKGRVLYLMDRTPLKQSYRVVGVALLTRKKPRVYGLYRLCFNGDVSGQDQTWASVELVNAAKDLAAAGSARLHLLVPSGMKPGEMCKAFSLSGGSYKERGETWVRA
jgi:hypothetical protein